ncbi:MAG: hypothetical protein CMP66_07300 [Flavobacteriales bacterium]|nr:hypothetical protein [Flavobacteriales bacterium]
MDQPENSKSIFRDRRTKRIIFALVSAVSILFLLLVLQRMHSKEQMAAFEAKVIEETALRDDLDDLIDEHDLLRNEYSELNDQLFQKDSIIRAYAADIKKLLRSEGQLKEAKRKIVRLKEISRKYITAIDSLLTLNANLAFENDSVKKANRIIVSRNKTLEQKNQQLANRVSTASILKAVDLDVEGLYYRASGREVSTTRANKIQNFRICFTILENKVTEAGTKELFVRILAPDGSVLNVANQIQEIELTDTTLQYSFANPFEYNNQNISDCVLWTRGNVLYAGNYRFEFIVENEVIGILDRKFR